MIPLQRSVSVVTDDFRQRLHGRNLHRGNSLPGPKLHRWAEGQEMVTLRFAVPAILATAAAAGCFSYFVIVSLPARFEADARLLDVRLPPAVLYSPSPSERASTQIDQPPNADDLAAAAFQKAAEEILRRAPDTRASVVTDELPMTGRIPLPKNRPIPR